MTPQRFEVWIPGSPQPKARPRLSISKKTGKTFVWTPKKTQRWEETVGLVMQSARPSRWPMDATYSVSADIFAARGDVDNVLKSVLDAGNRILWDDDRQVRRVEAEMFDAAPPGVKVRVEVR